MQVARHGPMLPSLLFLCPYTPVAFHGEMGPVHRQKMMQVKTLKEARCVAGHPSEPFSALSGKSLGILLPTACCFLVTESIHRTATKPERASGTRRLAFSQSILASEEWKAAMLPHLSVPLTDFRRWSFPMRDWQCLFLPSSGSLRRSSRLSGWQRLFLPLILTAPSRLFLPLTDFRRWSSPMSDWQRLFLPSSECSRWFRRQSSFPPLARRQMCST